MIDQKTTKLSAQVSRVSVFLTRDLSSSISLERGLEKKSLDLKRKLVEDRGRILTSIASRGRGRQTGGGIGAALGLLGIGGGGGLLRRGLKRTPKSPNQLLRMQKGTSNLSRASRLGKLARPLAIVGTGLDFIGRRAEGQTNVQAGVGAAGGLAGAIGGAKIGAAIGTAILPGAGTAIGGIGGSIIGSLSGGRIVDLFTGANRRRQFEEERVILRTQKTQFSEALDDFDNVLDKFEDVVGGLAIRRRDDDDEVGRRKRPSGFPKPPTIGKRIKKFLDKPSVQATGVTAAIAGLITLSVLTRGKTSTKSQTIIQELLKKTPALKDFTQKEQIVGLGRILERTLSKSDMQKIRMSTSPFLTKRGTVVPGQKGAPGRVKKKTNIVKRNIKKKEQQKKIERDQTKKIRKSIVDMKDFMKKSGFVEPSKLERRATELYNSDFRDLLIMRDKGQISVAQYDLALNRLKLNLKITLDRIGQYSDAILDFSSNPKNFDAMGNIIGKNLNDMVRKLDIFSGKVLPEINMENLIMKNLGSSIKRRLQEIIQKPKQDLIPPITEPKGKFRYKPTDLSSNNLESDSTNLALAPNGNIFFLMNQGEGDTINVVKNESDLRMENRNVDPTAAAYKYFELVQGLTV